MKFCLIGPGHSSIPPNGWGAVESIVWDYYNELQKKGHTVVIINEPHSNDIIEKTNSEKPHVVYIMYDDHIIVAPHIQCSRIFYMSHFAYITEPGFEQTRNAYFNSIFKPVIEYQQYITLNAISQQVLDVYKKYGFIGKSNIIHNGARSDMFIYNETSQYTDKSIYLAKIEDRKAQWKYQSIDNIHFAGNYQNSSFDIHNSNYLGEWNKATLYENLTKYANLILLSDGEADPLVVKEALVAGLGVVVSECASANLDLNKPFITVIPNDKLNDISFIEQQIIMNREISITMRPQIREYALSKFTWSSVIDSFLQNIPLRIALIGPGIMPIPPPGWGAVEILIWDYYKQLEAFGHKVDIINTPNMHEIVQLVNAGGFDFAHIHYDVFWPILDKLNCSKIAITSHYPYIDYPERYNNDGYLPIFQSICNNSSHYIFALSKKDYNMFHNNCTDKSKLFLMLNGANSLEIQPVHNGYFNSKSIYIGKVEDRKLQHKYCNIQNIHFYGKCDNESFRQKECYKGEFNHQELMRILVNYGNLVLLSTGESDPLVIKEALMAGLPIVTNRFSANDLNLSLPFIHIIPDDKLDDLAYIESVINENRTKQIYKDAIREYALREFSWGGLVKTYSDTITLL